MKQTRPVLPGQVFRSNDRRETRYVRVIGIHGDHANVEPVYGGQRTGHWHAHAHARVTAIRLRAFNSPSQRGFTLVDAPWPVDAIRIDIQDGSDLFVDRLVRAIEQEARDFLGEHRHLRVMVRDTPVLEVTGGR